MKARRHLVVLLLALAAAAFALTPGAPATPPVVAVGVDLQHERPPVPGDFLGLSFEVRSLPGLARLWRTGSLPVLMRSLSPAVVRFGGITADTEVAWASRLSPRPAWAHRTVSASDFDGVGRLVRDAGWRVLLTVNLAHYDPRAAADEVASARRQLHSRLTAIELGNEPDYYGRHGYRPLPWTFDDYQVDVSDYRSAIESTAGRVPVAGPDATSTRSLGWLRREALEANPALLTAHYYPLGCTEGGPAVTIPHLLSPALRADEDQRLGEFERISRRSRIPLRIDETNNVSCGGKPGVSDTFAAALWATDYIVRAMQSGVAGVNLHDTLICRGYSPLCATSGSALAHGVLAANPEWYALLLTHQLVGSRPLPIVVAPRSQRVAVAAFAARGGRLQLVAVDFDPNGNRPALVRLRLPARYRAGTALRLSAPAAGAKRGVTLGGRPVASDGSWRPAARLPRVVARGGTTSVAVPASSAVLVTFG